MGNYTEEDLDSSLWAAFDSCESDSARDRVAAVVERFNRLTGRGQTDAEGNTVRSRGGNTVCKDGSKVFPLIKFIGEKETLIVHHDIGTTATRFVLSPDSGTIKEENFEKPWERFTEPVTVEDMPLPTEQISIADKLHAILQGAIQAEMTYRLTQNHEL